MRDNRVDFPEIHGFVCTLHMFNFHLCLAVSAKPLRITIVVHVTRFLSHASCHLVCQRHGVLSLIIRALDHALVTSTVIRIILTDVHTCDVGAMPVDVKQYLTVFVPFISTRGVRLQLPLGD